MSKVKLSAEEEAYIGPRADPNDYEAVMAQAARLHEIKMIEYAKNAPAWDYLNRQIVVKEKGDFHPVKVSDMKCVYVPNWTYPATAYKPVKSISQASKAKMDSLDATVGSCRLTNLKDIIYNCYNIPEKCEKDKLPLIQLVAANTRIDKAELLAHPDAWEGLVWVDFDIKNLPEDVREVWLANVEMLDKIIGIYIYTNCPALRQHFVALQRSYSGGLHFIYYFDKTNLGVMQKAGLEAKYKAVTKLVINETKKIFTEIGSNTFIDKGFDFNKPAKIEKKEGEKDDEEKTAEEIAYEKAQAERNALLRSIPQIKRMFLNIGACDEAWDDSSSKLCQLMAFTRHAFVINPLLQDCGTFGSSSLTGTSLLPMEYDSTFLSDDDHYDVEKALEKAVKDGDNKCVKNETIHLSEHTYLMDKPSIENIPFPYELNNYGRVRLAFIINSLIKYGLSEKMFNDVVAKYAHDSVTLRHSDHTETQNARHIWENIKKRPDNFKNFRFSTADLKFISALTRGYVHIQYNKLIPKTINDENSRFDIYNSIFRNELSIVIDKTYQLQPDEYVSNYLPDIMDKWRSSGKRTLILNAGCGTGKTNCFRNMMSDIASCASMRAILSGQEANHNYGFKYIFVIVPNKHILTEQYLDSKYKFCGQKYNITQYTAGKINGLLTSFDFNSPFTAVFTWKNLTNFIDMFNNMYTDADPRRNEFLEKSVFIIDESHTISTNTVFRPDDVYNMIMSINSFAKHIILGSATISHEVGIFKNSVYTVKVIKKDPDNRKKDIVVHNTSITPTTRAKNIVSLIEEMRGKGFIVNTYSNICHKKLAEHFEDDKRTIDVSKETYDKYYDDISSPYNHLNDNDFFTHFNINNIISTSYSEMGVEYKEHIENICLIFDSISANETSLAQFIARFRNYSYMHIIILTANSKIKASHTHMVPTTDIGRNINESSARHSNFVYTKSFISKFADEYGSSSTLFIDDETPKSITKTKLISRETDLLKCMSPESLHFIIMAKRDNYKHRKPTYLIDDSLSSAQDKAYLKDDTRRDNIITNAVKTFIIKSFNGEYVQLNDVKNDGNNVVNMPVDEVYYKYFTNTISLISSLHSMLDYMNVSDDNLLDFFIHFTDVDKDTRFQYVNINQIKFTYSQFSKFKAGYDEVDRRYSHKPMAQKYTQLSYYVRKEMPGFIAKLEREGLIQMDPDIPEDNKLIDTSYRDNEDRYLIYAPALYNEGMDCINWAKYITTDENGKRNRIPPKTRKNVYIDNETKDVYETHEAAYEALIKANRINPTVTLKSFKTHYAKKMLTKIKFNKSIAYMSHDSIQAKAQSIFSAGLTVEKSNDDDGLLPVPKILKAAKIKKPKRNKVIDAMSYCEWLAFHYKRQGVFLPFWLSEFEETDFGDLLIAQTE